MKRCIAGVVFGVLLLSLAVVGVGESYGLYYAVTTEQDTALVVMNSGGGDTYYTIKLYNAFGTLLASFSGDLVAYESDYHVLSGYVDPGAWTWGLARVESPGLLTVGVETSFQQTWIASENVVDPIREGDNATYYWYGMTYSNMPDQTTGTVVVNPHSVPASATLYLYDSFGDPQETLDLVLDPYETDYYSSGDLVPALVSMWGILDLRATVPLVVAVEYFDASSTMLNVDQMTHAYYVE